MGWLGWTENQTLKTTIPAIRVAYEGRTDLLRAVFGSNESSARPRVTKRKASAKLFDALFGSGNTRQ